MKNISWTSVWVLLSITAIAQNNKQILDFEFEHSRLNGVLNLPSIEYPKGLVLLIHGSGKTNAVAQDWYADIRATFTDAGYAIYMWDKMGCGQSEGTFDINQSVYHSAEETIAAINSLKKKKIPGAHNICLYGGSRASWINPIVIEKYKDIGFWISVSGVDDKENFGYLLEQNLRIAGLPQDSIDLLVGEWLNAVKIHHAGGNYESALEATKNLRKNSFWQRFNGEISEKEYYDYQKTIMKKQLDEDTGLPIVVPGFSRIISKINCPVLALFGEKDMHVDWKKTKSYYEKTLAKNTDLTIAAFPNCNHNIFECQTGGFYEFQDHNLPYKRCTGFLDAIKNWLSGL